MKKIINRPEQIVMEMCQGMALAHPELSFSEKYRFITKKNLNHDKVTLISGGGSGHEPAHAGFVGDGMLDAAVCGDIFASPSQIQVYQAIRETKSGKGTLSIAKGFRKLQGEWEELVGESKDIASFLDACSLIIMEHCGGASGPIWGSAFRAAAKTAKGKEALKAVDMAEMLAKAVQGIQATGERSFGRGAVPGDKTLIDALVPCADTWSRLASGHTPMIQIFLQAAKAAEEGAESTRSLVARMGRAGTVGERSLGYPDAGAWALGAIFRELALRLTESQTEKR